MTPPSPPPPPLPPTQQPPSRITSRRGVALVWVLLILLMAVSASAALAAAASSAQAARQVDRARLETSDLLHAAEAPILDWLNRHASTIALPPDAAKSGGPEVAVLHDAWVVRDIQHELRITAWDQCGMVSLAGIKSGSALRLALPAHVLAEVDQVNLAPNAVPGLDLLTQQLERATRGSAYPLPEQRDGPRMLGGADVQSRLPVRSDHSPLTIGAVVATHQTPPPATGARSSNESRRPKTDLVSININTAPIELVESALRELGRGGIELIIAARAQGKSASPGPAAPQSRREGEHDQRIQLVTSSHAWAFRIDIRTGHIQQSWWAVYLRSPRGSWECVQRLAITD